MDTWINALYIAATPYLTQLLSVSVIAFFMAISPGADFVMITRNSLFYNRTTGLYSALGISAAIWVHVAYSIAGLAVIIANSVILFSIIKYLGAAYLIYIGWKTLTTKAALHIDKPSQHQTLTPLMAFKTGFICNVLNPKTTLFFLSLFTQVVDSATPLWLQLTYGMIISVAHLLWFSAVAGFLTHPALLKKFMRIKPMIEKAVGTILIGLGLKVATTST